MLTLSTPTALSPFRLPIVPTGAFLERSLFDPILILLLLLVVLVSRLVSLALLLLLGFLFGILPVLDMALRMVLVRADSFSGRSRGEVGHDGWGQVVFGRGKEVGAVVLCWALAVQLV